CARWRVYYGYDEGFDYW
nr:immunoglobulin heavy chain junction region [Mus musculus]